MISLLRAELRRFTSRRLMRVLAIGSFVLLVLVLGRVAMVSHKETPAEQQRREAVIEQTLRQCEESKQRGFEAPETDCAALAEGSYYGLDPRLHAESALPGTVDAVAVTVALLAFVTGASFVGAEWHTGMMQALLFWEPRRGRVLFAKAAALVVCVLGFLFVFQAVAYAGTYLVAATRGTTEGVTTGLHLSNLLTVLRSGIMVSFVALLAYAVTGLARITAAALGAGFVYFAILENLVRGLRPGWQRFLVSENFAAILDKKTRVAAASTRSIEDFFEEPQMFTLTGVRGVVTLGIYLAVMLGAYYLVFTRRDVT